MQSLLYLWFSLSFRSHLLSLQSIFLSICYAVRYVLYSTLKNTECCLYFHSPLLLLLLPCRFSVLCCVFEMQFNSYLPMQVYSCACSVSTIFMWIDLNGKKNIILWYLLMLLLFLPLIVVHITNRASTYTPFNICTERPTHKEHMDGSVFVSFSYIFFNLKYKFSFHSVSSVVWCVFDCELNTEYLALILWESESIRE